MKLVDFDNEAIKVLDAVDVFVKDGFTGFYCLNVIDGGMK